MTPDEKASELVAKFMPYTLSYKDEYSAKQCALIAAEEIFSSRPVLPSPKPAASLDECIEQAKKYWGSVKQSILKL